MPRLPANALRPAAVRLLMGFMGAAWGSLYSLQAFCADVRGCYRVGWAPQQLFDVLGPEELGQVTATTRIQHFSCASFEN